MITGVDGTRRPRRGDLQGRGSEEGDACACADDDHPGPAVVENITIRQRRSEAVDAGVVHGCQCISRSELEKIFAFEACRV